MVRRKLWGCLSGLKIILKNVFFSWIKLSSNTLNIKHMFSYVGINVNVIYGQIDFEIKNFFLSAVFRIWDILFI